MASHRHIPTLSIILLTHATPAHLAAFAHCCKHFPLFQQIPVYATSPVISLGRTLLQDIYASSPLASTIIPKTALAETSYSYQSSISDEDLNILLQPPTPQEIDKYFSLIHPLKYSQPHQPLPSPFSPPLNDLTVTAYNAGHTLGGTIWNIQHGMESIVYAVDWNQVRENVLAGAAWLGGSGGGGAEVIAELRKPTALICSSRGAEKATMAGGRKKRDDMLMDLIRNTVAKGGSILIPTDTSARVLELAYVLEHQWRRDMGDLASEISLKKAKLYLASSNAGATMRHVRSMLEWMDENVVKEFESEATGSSSKQHKRGESTQTTGQGNTNRDGGTGKSSSPFEFQYLKMLESRKRIEKIMSRGGPKIILASDTCLEWGFSKILLERMATGSSNLIVLTDDFSSDQKGNDSKRTIYGTLRRWYEERKDGMTTEIGSDGSRMELSLTNNRSLQIMNPKRVPLEGKELLIYQQYLATQRQSQNLSKVGTGATALETSADAVDETSSTSSSSEESDPERQGKALNVSAKTARFNRNKAEPTKENLGINVLVRQPGVYDYDVRGKKGRDQMFPFVSKRRRIDDFGDLIKPEEYLRAEERDDADGQDIRDNGLGKQEGLGQKRKWQDTRQSDPRSGDEGPNKRRQQNRAASNRMMTNSDPRNHINGTVVREDESSDESDDESEENVSVPSKIVTGTDIVAANCKIAYVDFTGLHDQRSLSMLIPLVRPKKLVLIGGKPSETNSLAEDCRQKLQGEHADGRKTSFVYTPSVGQTVDASVDTNAWTVKLSDALVRRFHWQNVRGLSVVTLMGHLATTVPPEPADEPSSRKKLKMLKGEAEETKLSDVPAASEKAPELAPTLDVVPANMAAATRSVAQPLHVGDLRLADLRKVLQSTGHTAEFRGEGTLLIDGLVAVRKSGTGKIEVESGGRNLADMKVRALEGSFYAVKRKIYEGLAVIAGG